MGGSSDARNVVADNLQVRHPEERRFSLVRRAGGAVESADAFHLVVVSRIFVAAQCRWTFSPKLRTAFQRKRCDIAPGDKQRGGIRLVNARPGRQCVRKSDG